MTWWTHWSLEQCLSCLLNVQALDRDACTFKQACKDDRSRGGSQAVAQGSKSFPQRSYSWWKTLEGRSCDSRTKSSLGLNCTTWRSYIHGGLVLGITLLVPPTKTALLHLPPTLGVALVAFESANNHMRKASIRVIARVTMSQRGPRMADPILYCIPIRIVRVSVQRRTRPVCITSPFLREVFPHT